LATTTEAKQISVPALVTGLAYTMALQGFFAFYLLRYYSEHSYGWAFIELLLLVLWTWILKGKLDKWRTPE
jgi:hypothetical protein